ncbi:hypothetical protein [Sphingopyxis alaskensis]|jgi:hypothetical protein|uniref:Uncharacterized protein n=1 Tax=Sphingopyxis alaskensis (strain DSM 13593 / LMG 18877 / RB2256) TaxID=317655 RepID=Q1GSG2_SPHAL|nr:hypothetical protein [Sphingopyxis alaskensis]ABF53410.1 hypothetical protein Sala_1697 [Sphingopyxis alaskensis RB2256]MCM3419851.1 hypothetical protein [Sphingopyxis alaskensis]
MIAWSAIAAGLAIVVALAHSAISERVILQPLFRQPAQGLLATEPGRGIVRAVFHIPSVAWAALGLGVWLNRLQNGPDLVAVIAMIVFASSAISNLVALRRPHPGGLLLLLATATTATDLIVN